MRLDWTALCLACVTALAACSGNAVTSGSDAAADSGGGSSSSSGGLPPGDAAIEDASGDLSAEGSPGDATDLDSAMDGGGCGNCGAGDLTRICVEHLTLGGVVIPPDDAGACPAGRVVLPEAPNLCSVAPVFSCETLPGACFPTGSARPANCVCAPSLCSGHGACADVSPELVTCTLDVP